MSKQFSISEIKKIREATGAPVMDIKAAMLEAKGDSSKAREILKAKGILKAEKKSQRQANCGLIECYVHNGKIGVLVEINCETDFVARTDQFKDFAHNLALHIAAMAPKYLSSDDIPKKELESQKRLIQKQLAKQFKSGPDLEKAIARELDLYYQQVCLANQPYIKDPKLTISQLVKQQVASFGENIVIRRFIRYQIGETSQ